MNALMQTATEVAAEQSAQTEPREWWMVTRPGADGPFRMYRTRENAEIIRAAQEVEYPSIGPWRVVHLVEQPA